MDKLRITGKGPINIALVKYWGKDDEENIIPSNNSISLTLDMNEFYTQTTAELDIDSQTGENILILNYK
jgi:diphosphomevalonate decarboxylase